MVKLVILKKEIKNGKNKYFNNYFNFSINFDPNVM